MLTVLKVVVVVVVVAGSFTTVAARPFAYDREPASGAIEILSPGAVPLSASGWHPRSGGAPFRWILAHLTAWFALAEWGLGPADSTLDNQLFGSTVSCGFAEAKDGWLVAPLSRLADPAGMAGAQAASTASALFDAASLATRSSAESFWTWIGAPASALTDGSALHIETLNGDLYIPTTEYGFDDPPYRRTYDVARRSNDAYLSWLLLGWLLLALPFQSQLRSAHGRLRRRGRRRQAAERRHSSSATPP